MKRIIVCIFTAVLFFSCESTDVDFFAEKDSEEKTSVVTTQNEIFLPESVSEIDFGSTKIQLKTDEPKANVYLNNIYQGRTPISVESLAPGYYQLKVEFVSASESVEKNFLIEIKNGQLQNYYIEK